MSLNIDVSLVHGSEISLGSVNLPSFSSKNVFVSPFADQPSKHAYQPGCYLQGIAHTTTPTAPGPRPHHHLLGSDPKTRCSDTGDTRTVRVLDRRTHRTDR